jgi:hypothetical protein
MTLPIASALAEAALGGGDGGGAEGKDVETTVEFKWNLKDERSKDLEDVEDRFLYYWEG